MTSMVERAISDRHPDGSLEEDPTNGIVAVAGGPQGTNDRHRKRGGGTSRGGDDGSDADHAAVNDGGGGVGGREAREARGRHDQRTRRETDKERDFSRTRPDVGARESCESW